VRNSLLAGAVLAAALAAACRRAPEPEPDPAAGVTLTAPAASTIVSPLSAPTTTYTNEMAAQNFRAEAETLGISRLSRPGEQRQLASDGPTPQITYQEGVDRTRAASDEFAAQRHAIERGKDKTVAIPTETAGLIPGKKDGGAPIESAPENTGSKDPENK
jgi:hypothetical protein